MSRDQKVQVWEATKLHYACMPLQDSRVVDVLDLPRYQTAQRPFAQTKLTWHEADCVNVAMAMKARGLNPLLLNMASDFQPGGGVWKGASAQEEELFRRSNYFKFLHRRWYPFSVYRTIVSRGVEFYRGSADQNYALLPTPVHLDCVAVAGIRRPNRTNDQRRFAHTEDANILLTKLRLLVQVALDNGNDSLVLSALGCGAFQGPVQHIAEIFKKVVQESQGRFSEISFAILGENYTRFRRGFEAPVIVF